METMLHDLRHALRSLRQSLGFTITAVAALALGIGASTAIFSVVNAVLLRPLPFPEPERLVMFTTTKGDGQGPGASPATFNFWREQAQAFQNISAFKFGAFSVTDGSETEQVPSARVGADFFRLFGVPIMQGRGFSKQEDVPGGGRVAVLSHKFWKRRLAGDPGVIGKTISFNGEPYVVIGVLGDRTNGWTFPDGWQSEREADVWVPFQVDPNSREDNVYLTVAGRLKPGVTLSMAKAQLKVLAEQFHRRFPSDLTMGPKDGFNVEPIGNMLTGDIREQLEIFISAVGMVLLIACANVASLLLIRATGRKRELAIRAALGASRCRIVRQLLTESVTLSIVGGALGLIVGMIGIRALLALSPGNIPHIGENGSAVTADWRVVSFMLLVSCATGILFGVFPAFQASRTDLSTALKANGGRSGTSYRQSKTRSLLVVTEVKLALVLLVGAGLLIRTLVALRSVNPAFDAHNVLTLQMTLNGPQFSKPSGVTALVRDSLERIRALPGVTAAAHTCCLPIEGQDPYGAVVIVGRPATNTHDWVRTATISPDYFDVFRIPLLRGRMFTDRDGAGAAQVVMINEAMARRFWGKDGADDPLKGSVTFEDLPGLPPWQIVGIVRDAHEEGLNADPRPTVYFPVAQDPEAGNTYILRSPVAWAVRTRAEPHALRAAIQRELMQASGGLPVGAVRSMDEILAHSTAGESFNMLLLSIFALAALLLAAIGIYGMMAYSVQQRTQEIGIRLALGAESNDVRNMVVWQGMRLALVGVGIGMAGAFCLRGVMESLVWRIGTADPMVFVAVPVLLSAVALFAVWFPARRASRTDPVEALRQE
jgi:putative ABC transport system permease protein